MTYRSSRSLKISALNSGQGEGDVHVRVAHGAVTDLRLEIYRPPRFFEGFLSGRAHTEPPDITARICGTCPVAHQASACGAIEDICGVSVGPQITALRRLLSCGEWIASHARHIYLLHSPDFLGYAGVVEMARDHRDLVERGLALKKAGNDLLDAVGGRAIHPDNVRVGGFHRAPDPARLRALAADTLRRALDDALATVEWVAGFDFPQFTNDHELLALHAGDRYPMEGGVPRTSSGRTLPLPVLDARLAEAESAIAGAPATGHPYLTGPIARYGLNALRLAPVAREAANAAKLPETFRNPFRSIVVRAVELVHAVAEALVLIDGYQPPEPPAHEVPPRPGTGYGASEAPRGLLLHRYTLAEDGTLADARIVPPTLINQAIIQDDLRRLIQERLELDDRQLASECEQAIRNYDPCLCGATRFLNLTVVRS